MAVTFTVTADNQGRQMVGNQRVFRGRLTLAGTYETGGFLFVANDVGFSRIDSLELGAAWTTTTALVCGWDSANGRIKLFETGAVVDTPLDEVDNTNSVAGRVIDFVVYGA